MVEMYYDGLKFCKKDLGLNMMLIFMFRLVSFKFLK